MAAVEESKPDDRLARKAELKTKIEEIRKPAVTIEVIEPEEDRSLMPQWIRDHLVSAAILASSFLVAAGVVQRHIERDHHHE